MPQLTVCVEVRDCMGWAKETLLDPQASHSVLIMQKPDTGKPPEAADKPTSNAEAAPAEASRGVGENAGSKALPEHDPGKEAAGRKDTGPSAVPPQVSLPLPHLGLGLGSVPPCQKPSTHRLLFWKPVCFLSSLTE